MSDIIPYDAEQHNVVVQRNKALMDLRDSMFKKGLHYGEPFKGSGKPTLLKPGAEIIMARFRLWPEYIDRGVVEKWDTDAPIFHYRYECKLRHRETNEVWGAGIGSCNSLEDKYRWRNLDRKCPQCGAENIRKSKNKDEWYCWAKTGGCGATFAGNDPRIIDQPIGKIPNDEIFTLVNTFDKMAQKRALVAAILIATGASTFFTQDVEDFPGYAGEILSADDVVIVDGDTGEIIDSPPPPAKPDRRMATGPGTPGASTRKSKPAAVEVFDGAVCEKMAAYMVEIGTSKAVKHATNIIMEAITEYNDGVKLSWEQVYAAKYTKDEVWAQVLANRAAQVEATA